MPSSSKSRNDNHETEEDNKSPNKEEDRFQHSISGDPYINECFGFFKKQKIREITFHTR